MKKIWKVILGILGFAITILLVFLGKKKLTSASNFKKELEDNNKEIEKVQEKISKVEVEKEVIKDKIEETSNDIIEVKEKIENVDVESAKEVINNFENKYRRK